MKTRSWLVLLITCATLPACLVNYDETTLVSVRHPSAVSVGVQGPNESRQWLIAAEGPPREAELPASRPPFSEVVRYAVAIRERSGAIRLDCPSCEGATGAIVVPAIGPIELRGSPSDTLRWPHQGLEMRFGHDARFPCRRGHGKCSREALALWLSTPAENVVEIRYRKLLTSGHGERAAAWISAFTGATFLGGGALLVGGSFEEHGPSGPAIALGSAAMLVGGFFLTVGILGVAAQDSETTVHRPD